MTQTKLMPDNRDYFTQLDGLRFLAVAAVMFAHSMVFTKLTQLNLILASCGVNFFFVLSGFLISGLLLKSKVKDNLNKNTHWFSLKQFYARRTLRIFPIYYLVIIVAFVFNLKPAREIIWWLVTYTSNIYWCKYGYMVDFGHLWSLAVEEQFYLFFPFVIFFVPKRYLLTSLYFIIALSILSRFFGCFFYKGIDNVSTYAFTPCCLDSFCVGVYSVSQK